MRVRGLEIRDCFQTLVAPRMPLPRPVGLLTGLSDAELRGAPGVRLALRRFSKFAGGAVLVAHNARFDVGFVNRELERMTGKRLHATVIDTVPLARNLLGGRSARTSLAALSYFFGVSVQPCHRALPDAQATSEVFLRLVELAQERGASTLSELEEIAAPRPRRIHAKRGLVHGRRPGPGSTSSMTQTAVSSTSARRATCGHGCARTSTRSGRGRRSRRRSTRSSGSSGACSAPSSRRRSRRCALIRRLRPPANARTPSPESYVYLHRRGERFVLSAAPSAVWASAAEGRRPPGGTGAQGLPEEDLEDLLDGITPDRVRERLVAAVEAGHELDARRLMRQLASLDRVAGELARIDRVRRLAVCLLVPGGAFVVQGGRVTRHDDLAAVTRLPEPPVVEADRLDELLVAASFLDAPPPELTAIQL